MFCFVQPAAFGYQPQIIRPGGAQIPNYIGYPNVPLRQGQQGQRAGGRRGGAPQQQQQQQPQQQVHIIFSSPKLSLCDGFDTLNAVFMGS